MENKINEKTKNDQTVQNSEYDRIWQAEQMDKLIGERYDAETRILENALLKAAGRESWDDFPQESEEEIQKGYDRLIAHLKEKGEYRENPFKTQAKKAEEIQKIRKHFGKCENEWNRIHRIVKPAAAVVAAVMLTALLGMASLADTEPVYKIQEDYEISFHEKK